jgi:hypothetical protein
MWRYFFSFFENKKRKEMRTLADKLRLFRMFKEKDPHLADTIIEACPALQHVKPKVFLPIVRKELDESLKPLRQRFRQVSLKSLRVMLSLSGSKVYGSTSYEKCIDMLFVELAQCKNQTSMIMGTPVQQLMQKLYFTPDHYCHSIDDILEYLMSNPLDENKDPLGGGRLWKYDGKKNILIWHQGIDPEVRQKYQQLEKELQKKRMNNVVKDVSPAFLNAFKLLGKLIVVLIKLKGLEEAKRAELAMFHFSTYLEKNLSPKEVKIMYGLHFSGPTVREVFDEKDECLHFKGQFLATTYAAFYRVLQPSFPSIFHKDMTREDAFRYLKELETAAKL